MRDLKDLKSVQPTKINGISGGVTVCDYAIRFCMIGDINENMICSSTMVKKYTFAVYVQFNPFYQLVTKRSGNVGSENSICYYSITWS